MIKSPLRFVGGKSKALPHIIPHIPPGLNKFVETFIGGGSVGWALLSGCWAKSHHFNDIDESLICFYQALNDPDDNQGMMGTLTALLECSTEEKKTLFKLYKNSDWLDPFKYYFVNRCSFSGTGRYGGFSSHAAEKRFTKRGIDNLANYVGLLDDVTLTVGDYSKCLVDLTEDDFVYSDPPYLIASDNLYIGHKDFDHARLAKELNALDCRVLISYNDCKEIRDLYEGWNFYTYELQYGASIKKGQELLIRNY